MSVVGEVFIVRTCTVYYQIKELTVARLQTGDWRIDFLQDGAEIFLFSSALTQSLGLSQRPDTEAPGLLSLG
jgi:hypothetical protein